MESSRTFAALSILLATAGGCAVAPDEDPEDDTAVAAEEMNGHNSLSNWALGANSVTANRRALAFLRVHSLSDATAGGTVFGDYPEMRFQLHDPMAREAMRYIVSCALPAGSGVTYADPFPGEGNTTFSGEHGLCTGWLGNAPSQACLERVTGCVLARVNAAGVRVPLSLRGPIDTLSLASTIKPDAQYKDGAVVASLTACASRTYGLGRSCGFAPIAVGACTPGTAVTVGAGASASGCSGPLGYSSGDTMLRICQGIYGCDPTTPYPDAAYAGVIAQNDDRCGLKPAATFTCPPSGSYSVMAATYDSSVPQSYVTSPSTFAVQASAGTLAAPETQVFPYLEGAFYGDIFDAENLADGVDYHVEATGQVTGSYNLVVPTVFRRAYACYGPRWADGAAVMTSRMCAAPGAGCLMQIAGACADSVYAPPSEPRYRCQTSNASGEGDFGGCLDRDGAARWSSPITTYLNDPCDALIYPGSWSPVQCAQAVFGAGP